MCCNFKKGLIYQVTSSSKPFNNQQGVVTSSLVNFDPSSNGSELWKPLLDEGHFPPISSTSGLLHIHH